MLETRTGILLIAGLGFFGLAFLSNAVVPITMYRHLPEQSVEQLPEHHRVVFVLRELEGKTYEEIAEITGCNLGTVKSRLNRARNSFASIIAPHLD